MYVLDTNAIIYYTDDEPAAVATLEPIFSENDPIYISTLVELELLSQASMTEDDEARIDIFLGSVQILPLTSRIARIAGDLRRLYPRLKAFDSGIAATALFTNSTLITRNLRDFQSINDLSVMPI
ncbi:MAG: type II toxin-antitoxin system VapC family toxin [Candidatus Tectomicrobia bacterium]|nr:type II toxin-antitoxin system VapC family toxin [Candidatus Tectomicrobia bacterium]